MNATIDLLHERGIARTSTPEIARLAGVSRGALTHHFASREAIISASVADLLGSDARSASLRRGLHAARRLERRDRRLYLGR